MLLKRFAKPFYFTDVTQPDVFSGVYSLRLSFLRKQESAFFRDSCFRRNDRVRNMSYFKIRKARFVTVKRISTGRFAKSSHIQQIEKFAEECKNCILAPGNRTAQPCKNTISALRNGFQIGPL